MPKAGEWGLKNRGDFGDIGENPVCDLIDRRSLEESDFTLIFTSEMYKDRVNIIFE
jgi:hypothetical protein